MAKILIVYGTTEGHTRKIAETVGEWLRTSGNTTEIFDSANLPKEFSAGGFDAYIIAGSIHQGHHQKPLTHFVRQHVEVLHQRPSALLSASMSAATPGDEGEALTCIDKFIEETGWHPTVSTPVAGALLYTHYDWLKRMIMKSISKKKGGETDTSHDFEYTDWDKLRSFVESFMEAHLRDPAMVPTL